MSVAKVEVITFCNKSFSAVSEEAMISRWLLLYVGGVFSEYGKCLGDSNTLLVFGHLPLGADVPRSRAKP
jgi:hypothetical protein